MRKAAKEQNTFWPESCLSPAHLAGVFSAVVLLISVLGLSGISFGKRSPTVPSSSCEGTSMPDTMSLATTELQSPEVSQIEEHVLSNTSVVRGDTGFAVPSVHFIRGTLIYNQIHLIKFLLKDIKSLQRSSTCFKTTQWASLFSDEPPPSPPKWTLYLNRGKRGEKKRRVPALKYGSHHRVLYCNMSLPGEEPLHSVLALAAVVFASKTPPPPLSRRVFSADWSRIRQPRLPAGSQPPASHWFRMNGRDHSEEVKK